MYSSQELFQRINEGMKEERFHAFARNLEKNIPYIEKYGGLESIPEKFNGRHVIIAAAGSSLISGIELLKKFYRRQEIVLVAADMALRTLLLKGIRPDFVVSCETTPVDFFSDIDTSGIHLLAFSCIWNGYLRKWKGEISFYNWQIHDEEYSRLWNRAGVHLGFVATGSVVTTQAVSIALGGDIASLMLMGNDLAFKDRFYAPGTCREKSQHMMITRFTPEVSLQMLGIRRNRDFELKRGSRSFSTNNQFLAAKSWLEELFSKATPVVYDLSLPGCAESAVHKITPAEYFSIFQKKRRKRK